MMIKIDYKKVWDDHIWFGWHHVPKLMQSDREKHWYFLGWDFAWIPMLRKGTNPPNWYMKLFKNLRNFR